MPSPTYTVDYAGDWATLDQWEKDNNITTNDQRYVFYKGLTGKSNTVNDNMNDAWRDGTAGGASTGLLYEQLFDGLTLPAGWTNLGSYTMNGGGLPRLTLTGNQLGQAPVYHEQIPNANFWEYQIRTEGSNGNNWEALMPQRNTLATESYDTHASLFLIGNQPGNIGKIESYQTGSEAGIVVIGLYADTPSTWKLYLEGILIGTIVPSYVGDGPTSLYTAFGSYNFCNLYVYRFRAYNGVPYGEL